uniref:Innexin n=1 Tax=Girardia tigrina TaxID=6162 RepID=Q9NCL5_GIRTI|nr:putative gap junction protein pannexin [Girardia tigrina]
MVFNTGLLAFVQGLKLFSLRTRRDDDFTDRLSHHYTALFLLITSILISSKQYVGDPIHCWVPKEFSDPWQKYANNYCWIKNTYTVPSYDFMSIPKPDERKKLEINYYQWVPIVLLIQSLLFYFPTIIWRILNWTVGINIQDMIGKAMDVCSTIRTVPEKEKNDKTESKDEKEEQSSSKEEEPEVPGIIRDIANHLEISIEFVEKSKSNFVKALRNLFVCGFGSRKYGSYLITLYFVTKLLYIINVIGQIFLLTHSLNVLVRFFGFKVLSDLGKGDDWKSTGHFPRVTMCDFQIRNLGQRTNYSVQCVLPINLFNKKIYIFIWFWIFLVSILTVYSFFHWIFRMLSFQKVKFIRGLLLKGLNKWSGGDNDLLRSFINDYLKSDGVFLMYLIYINSGDIVTTQLLEVLWFRFKQKNKDSLKITMTNMRMILNSYDSHYSNN